MTTSPAKDPEAQVEGGVEAGVSLAKEDPSNWVSIGQGMSSKTEQMLLEVLRHNTDMFTWYLKDLTGMHMAIIEHRLAVHPDSKPLKQKL